MPEQTLTEQLAAVFSEAYPELAEEGKFLLDFMKLFKPGRRKEKNGDGGGEG